MTEFVTIAVNGTLMRGLALNANLTNNGANFLREARTAPCYRLWSIAGRYPAMLKSATGGTAIALELWDIPPVGLVQVLLAEPPGLAIGKLALQDGTEALGVLAEPWLIEGQPEITALGGWRAYLASQALYR